MKKKFLALTMASAVMLMGAGYAYWTDASIINNTVTTGEFAVNFVNADGYPKLFGATGEKYVGQLDPTGNMGKIITTNDSKHTTVNISNMYPGREMRYEIKVRNDGTIPVVFNGADVDLNGTTAGFADKLMIQVQVAKWHKHVDGTADHQFAVGEAGYWAGQSLGFKPLANLQTNLNTIMSGLMLEPGEFITFDVPDADLAQWKLDNPGLSEGECVTIKLPETVGTAANPDEFEKATAKFNMTLNWKQHNAPPVTPGTI